MHQVTLTLTVNKGNLETPDDVEMLDYELKRLESTSNIGLVVTEMKVNRVIGDTGPVESILTGPVHPEPELPEKYRSIVKAMLTNFVI